MAVPPPIHTYARIHVKFIYILVWGLKGPTSPIFLHKLNLYISICSVYNTCPTPTLACCSYNTETPCNAELVASPTVLGYVLPPKSSTPGPLQQPECEMCHLFLKLWGLVTPLRSEKS